MVAISIAATAQAGGHRGYPQPVYLVPAVPVAYAPAPIAYAPVAYAPVAYAPAGHPPKNHFHKAKGYAYPTAAYAPAPGYPYGAAPAPVAYNVVGYSAPAPAASAPPANTYQWKLVKTSEAAAPGADDASLPGLGQEKSEKVARLVRERLEGYSKTSMTASKKREELILSARDYYADELGKSPSELTTSERDAAQNVALVTLGERARSTVGAAPGDESGDYAYPAAAPAVYQLYLPQPAGGLFHHKYR